MDAQMLEAALKVHIKEMRERLDQAHPDKDAMPPLSAAAAMNL